MLRGALLAALLLLASLTAFATPAPATPTSPAAFLVGFGERDIDPSGQVDLGGFGFGCCRVSTAHEYPVHARAMVVGDGVNTAALVSVEVQGSFAAYADGAFGQYDIAKRVEAATGGALPRDHVIISSDHSHRGADTTGVWGGVADDYLQLIADQTTAAILDAYHGMAAARIRVAELNESTFVTSDFTQAGQDVPDGFFRVLYVEDDAGHLSGVYGTFAAHATLHGSTAMLSPDWPGIVSDKIAADEGVPVVLGEGAVGRTHPAGDRSVWEDQIAAAIEQNYTASQYVTAPGVAAGESAITLTAYNGILLSGLTVGKAGCAAGVGNFGSSTSPLNPTCYPIARANVPPWQTGNTLRTLVSAVRIGDVFLWGAPGEIYPNAQWAIQASVASPHVFVLGLANDQLGYLIAPSQDWYKVAAFNPSSDNTLFNVDITGGDHVTCAAIDLAHQLGFASAGPAPAICALWAAEDHSLPS